MGRKPRLSVEQEQELLAWAQEEHAKGSTPTVRTLLARANEKALELGLSPFAKSWIRAFRQRHPGMPFRDLPRGRQPADGIKVNPNEAKVQVKRTPTEIEEEGSRAEDNDAEGDDDGHTTPASSPVQRQRVTPTATPRLHLSPMTRESTSVQNASAADSAAFLLMQTQRHEEELQARRLANTELAAEIGRKREKHEMEMESLRLDHTLKRLKVIETKLLVRENLVKAGVPMEQINASVPL